MDIFKNVFSKIIHFPYSCFGLKQWGTFRVNRNLYLALHVSIKLIIS